MAREAALDDLYLGLTTLARRARDVGDDLHPGLSLVAYTLLTQVDVTPGMRAADLAAHFCLDKSTLVPAARAADLGRAARAVTASSRAAGATRWR